MWFVDTFDIERYLQHVQLPECAISVQNCDHWPAIDWFFTRRHSHRQLDVPNWQAYFTASFCYVVCWYIRYWTIFTTCPTTWTRDKACKTAIMASSSSSSASQPEEIMASESRNNNSIDERRTITPVYVDGTRRSQRERKQKAPKDAFLLGE